jgi:hypothetical protein
LNGHVEVLYRTIRQRMLIQYVAPYQRVKLQNMYEAFGCRFSIETLQNELVDLILSKELKGRIDDEAKVYTAYEPNPRAALYHKALQLSDQYRRQSHAMMVRMQLLREGVRVQVNEQ